MFLTLSCFNDVRLVKTHEKVSLARKHVVALTACDIIGLIAISPFQVLPTHDELHDLTFLQNPLVSCTFPFFLFFFFFFPHLLVELTR